MKVPEGYEDSLGWHPGKPPFPPLPMDAPTMDLTEAVFGCPEGEAPIPKVHCAYCNKVMGWHEGLILGGNHFDSLHCYVLWQKKQDEHPTRVAKIFKKKLL